MPCHALQPPAVAGALTSCRGHGGRVDSVCAKRAPVYGQVVTGIRGRHTLVRCNAPKKGAPRRCLSQKTCDLLFST